MSPSEHLHEQQERFAAREKAGGALAPYQPGTTCGIVLLPEASATAAQIAYGQRVADLTSGEVRLSPTGPLPHVTVVHVEASREAASALWADLAAVADEPLDLTAIAAYLRPGEGRCWFGLDIVKDDILSTLHAVVLDRCAARGLRVTTAAGPLYWPHVTLALWHTPPEQALPVDDAPLSRFQAQLALVTLGPFGTADEVLEGGSNGLA